jgi:hypothetical protein
MWISSFKVVTILQNLLSLLVELQWPHVTGTGKTIQGRSHGVTSKTVVFSFFLEKFSNVKC